MLELVAVAEPTPAMREAILGPLVAYNTAAGGPSNYAPCALLLKDGDAIKGGLWADYFYDWLSIHLIVVPEGHRHAGWGTRLLAAAETFTRARGGTGMWLDTFNFQARGFYEKHGFTCFGELPGHPTGGARFFMQKRL